MFDVSFSELLVIAVVALIVIGPEKLPKVARTLGAISGRMQRYIAQVKEEVNRETRFEELQQLQTEIQESAYVAEQKARRMIREVEASAVTLSDANESSEPEVIATPPNTQTARKPRAKQTAEPIISETAPAEKPAKKRVKKSA